MKRTKVKDKLKNQKAITLIALVITIIVLLILAGVSIVMLTGENGILTQASKAATLTEIAQVEEEANLIYLDLVSKKYLGDSSEVSMSDIVSQLTTKGYQIEQVATSEDAISGISLDSNSIKWNWNNRSNI